MAEIMRMRNILMLISSVRENPAKLKRTFMGQFLKGNSMGPIKVHNGGNYADAHLLNAYNFSLRQNSAKTYKHVHWTVFEGE